MHSFDVRTFRDGDERAIVELFNNGHSQYCGLVPRTDKYWRWCCLERPDVERDGIFLAFSDEELCGYIVAGSSGNIWEFCVVNDDREVVRALFDKAVGYLEKIGASSVNVNVPVGASIIKDLHQAGFSKATAGGMFVTTLNPARLVQALATPLEKALKERFDDKFAFQLLDAPYGVSKEFSVKIHKAAVEIDEGFPPDHSIIVRVELMDLVSVLLGGSSATRLLLTGKMRVKPVRKSRSVLKLLSTIRSSGPWFFPLADLV